MSFNPIPRYFPATRSPYSRIQPFTYRDGRTFIEAIEELSHFVRTSLIPSIDERLDTVTTLVVDALDSLDDAVAAAKAEAERAQDISDAIGDMLPPLEAIRDEINSLHGHIQQEYTDFESFVSATETSLGQTIADAAAGFDALEAAIIAMLNTAEGNMDVAVAHVDDVASDLTDELTAIGIRVANIVKPIWNLVTNPSFEVNTEGWSPVRATLTRDTAYPLMWDGARSGAAIAEVRANVGSGNAYIWSGDYALDGLPWVGVSALAATEAGRDVRLQVIWLNSGGGQISTASSPRVPAEFYPGARLVHAFEAPEAATHFRVVVVMVADSVGDRLWVDSVISATGDSEAEALVAVEAYFDGDSPGAWWEGEPHNSPSGYLSLPVATPEETASGVLKSKLVTPAGVRAASPLLSVKSYGAVGDGVADDSAAFHAAYAAGKARGGPVSIYVPEGVYRCPSLQLLIDVDGVTFSGAGMGSSVVRSPEVFNVQASDFTVRDIGFECIDFSQSATAIGNRSHTTLSRDISNITIERCSFEGYFYATYFASASYADASTPGFVPTYRVSDVSINHCRSVAPSGLNSGHFQHLAVHNAQAIGCTTYRGQNASSYNYIGNNGFLRVIGCYDDGNPYASTEIENSSGTAVVQGNTFRGDIWVDDSSDVAVTGNTVIDSSGAGATLRLTLQNHDVRNVTFQGNIADRALVASFGGTQNTSSVMDNIIFAGNVFRGSGSYGVNVGSVDGRLRTIVVTDNIMTGGFTNGAVGVTRRPALKALVSHNMCGGQDVIVTGTGGTVHVVANADGSVSGLRDPLYESWHTRVTSGMQMESDNGTRYRVYVGNAGTINAVAV